MNTMAARSVNLSLGLLLLGGTSAAMAERLEPTGAADAPGGSVRTPEGQDHEDKDHED
jgi:hypothetical protein